MKLCFLPIQRIKLGLDETDWKIPTHFVHLMHFTLSKTTNIPYQLDPIWFEQKNRVHRFPISWNFSENNLQIDLDQEIGVGNQTIN